MIRFEEAFETVMDHARVMDTEEVDLLEAPGRVLAQNVCSDLDMPPFNKSAMDGYACRREDLAHPLTVIEVIQAGCAPTRAIGPKECAKIMTGAPVPEGADCVIMVEHTEPLGEDKIRFIGQDTHHNICRQGEDVMKGDVVLRQGQLVAPQHVAVLASVGCGRPRVYCRPKVAVIATGDELVEPAAAPTDAQIRNSNSYQLCAQIAGAGAIPVYYGIARDTEASIDRVLKRALAEADVILVSGGVSMGDYDLVPGVMKTNGFRILFDSIAMKPGKPTTFGVCPEAVCIGLPGNPVSTFIQFEFLVKPFLHRMMGRTQYRVPVFSLPLAEAIARKRTERASWLPVRITANGEAAPREYHGSGHMNALCGADGFIMIPIGVDRIEKGSLVDVRPI